MKNNRKEFIGKIKWPFYRYDVLLPNQMKVDVFEWLYLTLIVNKNEQYNLPKNIYRDEAKAEVLTLLKKKFGEILDDQILDNITEKAEKDFVDKIGGRVNIIKAQLKPETFVFLETFSTLFSEQVKVQRVYQNALTGNVAPFFNEDYIARVYSDCDVLRANAIHKDKPTNIGIKKALLLYNKIKKNSGVILEEQEYIDLDFNDPDAEVGFGTFGNDDSKILDRVSNMPQGDKFDVVFLEDSRCIFNLEVNIFVENNKLVITTPFDNDTTFNWMNRELGYVQTSGIAKEVTDYIKELKSAYITEDVEKQDIYTQIKGVESQLKYMSKIYALVKDLGNQELCKLLIKMDRFFEIKEDSYFNQLGKYLECLIEPIKPIKISMTEDVYLRELSEIETKIGVDCRPLFSKGIVNNIVKNHHSFKKDLAFILITNLKVFDNSKLYDALVTDIFDLYRKRNEGSHYNEKLKLDYSNSQLEKLHKVTEAITSLYLGGNNGK